MHNLHIHFFSYLINELTYLYFLFDFTPVLSRVHHRLRLISPMNNIVLGQGGSVSLKALSVSFGGLRDLAK
jgi:hypothetical protein